LLVTSKMIHKVINHHSKLQSNKQKKKAISTTK
jgi:hypothetical protein